MVSPVLVTSSWPMNTLIFKGFSQVFHGIVMPFSWWECHENVMKWHHEKPLIIPLKYSDFAMKKVTAF